MYLGINNNILAHRTMLGINIYFDNEPKKCYSINKTAEMILTLCDGEKTRLDIINEISNIYNGLTDEEEKNIQDFIDALIYEGILYERFKKEIKKTKIYGRADTETPTSISIEITKKCPLRCIHCYTEAENNNNEYIKLEDLKKILNESSELGIPHIQLTGGEIFEYPGIIDIIKNYYHLFRTIILSTSGYTLREDMVEELKNCKGLIWRISIDGDEEIHNKIRQKNDAFQKAITAIKILRLYNFDVTVVYTINRLNINKIDRVLDIVRESGANNFEYGFTLEMGRASNKLIISPEEVEEINSKFATLNNHYHQEDIKFIDRNNNIDEFKQNCGAGWLKLSILANGDYNPCLNLPISLGNIKNITIKEIMNSSLSKFLKKCISPDKIECGKCESLKECRGCIGRAYSKNNCIYMNNFWKELKYNVNK